MRVLYGPQTWHSLIVLNCTAASHSLSQAASGFRTRTAFSSRLKLMMLWLNSAHGTPKIFLEISSSHKLGCQRAVTDLSALELVELHSACICELDERQSCCMVACMFVVEGLCSRYQLYHYA
jgi:hypothetical protein